MPTATTIDDVIDFASTDVALLSYGGVDSLFTAMTAWTDGMFKPAGIFPPANNDIREIGGQRVVSDWYAAHVKAIDLIQSEGTAAGDTGVVSTSACIDVIVRVANAVKYGVIATQITSVQETAVIALYNLIWP